MVGVEGEGEVVWECRGENQVAIWGMGVGMVWAAEADLVVKVEVMEDKADMVEDLVALEDMYNRALEEDTVRTKDMGEWAQEEEALGVTGMDRDLGVGLVASKGVVWMALVVVGEVLEEDP